MGSICLQFRYTSITLYVESNQARTISICKMISLVAHIVVQVASNKKLKHNMLSIRTLQKRNFCTQKNHLGHLDRFVPHRMIMMTVVAESGEVCRLMECGFLEVWCEYVDYLQYVLSLKLKFLDHTVWNSALFNIRFHCIWINIIALLRTEYVKMLLLRQVEKLKLHFYIL